MANYNSDYTGAQIDSAVSRANSTDVTAGTVAASKAVVVDSNKDITGFRHITATGTVTAANVSLTGNVDLGDASGDTVTITGSIDSNLIPATDDTYDIGSSSYAWQDIYLEGDIYLSDATEIDVASGNLTIDVAGDIEINADGGDITFKDASSTLAAIDSSGDFNVAGSIETATIDYTDGDLAITIADGGGVTFAQTSSQVSGSTIGNVTIANGSITDSSGTISLGDENLTTTGVGTFASLDISGNADIDGTMEADAYTVDGTALNEFIADTVGAMVSSNTETNITVTYEDGDNTLDFVIGTLNQDTTGTADNITVSANNSTDETVYPIFVDGATGSQGAESDTGLTYNPSSGLLTSTLFGGTLNTAAQGNVTSLGTLTALTVDNIAIDGTTIGHTGDTDLITLTSGVVTVAGELDATSLDISGDADIDGTLEADAITVDGTGLAEFISDTAGAMFSSNTESGITVTYEDGDNTIDLSVDAAQTGITSIYATDLIIGEDSQTAIDFGTANEIDFKADNAARLTLTASALYPVTNNQIDLGTSSLEFKDAFFDGTVTADAFAGPITGAVTGNADTATLATTVTVTDSTANTNFPVVFHNESNGLLDDTGALRYNPSTGELLVPKLTVAGATTTVDTVTMNAQNAIIFEGATADANETTLSIVDPTADHTQYLINQGGYIPVLAAATTTAISATPAELNVLDGVTAGTVLASSGVVVDSNKDIGTFRNITLSGELDAATLDISGDADIDGTLEADAITVNGTALATYIRDTVGENMVSSNTESGITVTYDTTNDNIDFAVDAAQTGLTSILNASLVAGRDADNQIKFSTDDEIIFRVAGGDGVTMKASGEIEATSLDISGAIDVDGTANLDAVDIDGAVQIDSTLTVGVDDTGHDVKFFGATATNGYMLWDESTDDLILGSASKMGIGNTSPTVKLQITGDSNEEDVILLEDNSGNDVGALRIHANAFILKGKHSTSPVQIQTHDGNEDIEVDPDGFIKFETAGSEAMRIDSSQNVGIGTASPLTDLTIAGNSTKQLHLNGTYPGISNNVFYNNATGAWDSFNHSATGASLGVNTDGSFDFRRATAADPPVLSYSMYIDTEGKVGIGTSSPDYTLDVEKSVTGNWLARVLNTATASNPSGLLVRVDDADSTGILLGANASGTYRFVVKPDGNVGIGTASPASNLHILHTDADAAAGPIITLQRDNSAGEDNNDILGEIKFQGSDSANTITTEYSTIHSKISNVSNTAEEGTLVFKNMVAGTSTTAMTIKGSNVGIGETSPPAPLTINQGADDGSIVEFKSSDVAHGMTDNYETDTYGAFSKASALGGGFRIEGYSEGKNGILLDGISDSDNTTKTSSAAGNVMIRAWKKSGSSWNTIEADGNLLTVGNGNAVRFIVDEDGDIFYDGSASAYDSYNDAQLVRAFDSTMAPESIIQSEWDKFVTYKEKDLVEANLMGKVSDKEKAEGVKPLVSLTGMSRLHNGAIWQQYTEMQKMKELMYDAMVELMGKEKADKKLKNHDIQLLQNNDLLN